MKRCKVKPNRVIIRLPECSVALNRNSLPRWRTEFLKRCGYLYYYSTLFSRFFSRTIYLFVDVHFNSINVVRSSRSLFLFVASFSVYWFFSLHVFLRSSRSFLVPLLSYWDNRLPDQLLLSTNCQTIFYFPCLCGPSLFLCNLLKRFRPGSVRISDRQPRIAKNEVQILERVFLFCAYCGVCVCVWQEIRPLYSDCHGERKSNG